MELYIIKIIYYDMESLWAHEHFTLLGYEYKMVRK